GIYKLNGGVSFYPVEFFAAGAFVQGQDGVVTITRRAATKKVTLYIDGIPPDTYGHTTDLHAPSAAVGYLLTDTTTGPAPIYETDPGVSAYLQVTDTPMSAEDVVANLAAICGAVACGDGIVSIGEACDDHNVLPGDGCSATCTVEECWQCSGSPSSCTPL